MLSYEKKLIDEIHIKVWDDDYWLAYFEELYQNNPDLADKYADEVWDNIPDSITDNINLGEFALAKYDQSGRNYINGVKHMRDIKYKNDNDYEQIKQAIQKLVDKFCESIGREFENLTIKQAMDLNIKVQRLLGTLKSAPQSSVKDSDVIGAMIAADKASGKYHRGSLGD